MELKSMKFCFFVFFSSFSALHHAALTGTTDMISVLIQAQAMVDIRDTNGLTKNTTNTQ